MQFKCDYCVEEYPDLISLVNHYKLMHEAEDMVEHIRAEYITERKVTK